MGETVLLFDGEQRFDPEAATPKDVEAMLPKEVEENNDNDSAETVLLPDIVETVPYLHLVGNPTLPQKIEVAIEVGQVFTIGRFDVSVGWQQSSFEFDKRTVAVSRHHAAIFRSQDGYFIKDLGSKAGTFVNGKKLIADEEIRLVSGANISIGNAGANYTWIIPSEV